MKMSALEKDWWLDKIKMMKLFDCIDYMLNILSHTATTSTPPRSGMDLGRKTGMAASTPTTPLSHPKNVLIFFYFFYKLKARFFFITDLIRHFCAIYKSLFENNSEEFELIQKNI